MNDISLSIFRFRNKNKDFTLICRDCVGGILYHQLGLRFLSPTINLFFTPVDFNTFCLNLKEYLSSELKEVVDKQESYPVGVLKPSETAQEIKVHFMHYESFKEAKQKWDERTQRVNFDNIYVVSTFCYPVEIASLSDKLIKDWNNIKYKKVMLVDKKYGFDDEFVIKKPEKCQEYAWLLYEPSKVMKWKRTFNKFNFIKFLNQKSHIKE